MTRAFALLSVLALVLAGLRRPQAERVRGGQHTRLERAGKSFNTIRATRAGAAVSIGVRGRTLEVIANSRGG